jgi:hypothetical protein
MRIKYESIKKEARKKTIGVTAGPRKALSIVGNEKIHR